MGQISAGIVDQGPAQERPAWFGMKGFSFRFKIFVAFNPTGLEVSRTPPEALGAVKAPTDVIEGRGPLKRPAENQNCRRIFLSSATGQIPGGLNFCETALLNCKRCVRHRRVHAQLGVFRARSFVFHAGRPGILIF